MTCNHLHTQPTKHNHNAQQKYAQATVHQRMKELRVSIELLHSRCLRGLGLKHVKSVNLPE